MLCFINMVFNMHIDTETVNSAIPVEYKILIRCLSKWSKPKKFVFNLVNVPYLQT